MKSANKSENTFQLLNSDKVSKPMAEFAQMCILLAIQRFPNSFLLFTTVISFLSVCALTNGLIIIGKVLIGAQP